MRNACLLILFVGSTLMLGCSKESKTVETGDTKRSVSSKTIELDESHIMIVTADGTGIVAPKVLPASLTIKEEMAIGVVALDAREGSTWKEKCENLATYVDFLTDVRPQLIQRGDHQTVDVIDMLLEGDWVAKNKYMGQVQFDFKFESDEIAKNLVHKIYGKRPDEIKAVHALNESDVSTAVALSSRSWNALSITGLNSVSKFSMPSMNNIAVSEYCDVLLGRIRLTSEVYNAAPNLEIGISESESGIRPTN